MALNEKIKSARIDAQKTQEQVAERIGLTKGAISQWETGQSVPDLEYFREFCLYTGASADFLLLDRSMADPLLNRLIGIWNQLSPEAKDKLLGAANRVLVEDQITPSNPSPNRPKTQFKRVKRPPLS